MNIFDAWFGRSPDYKLPEIPDTKVGDSVEEAQRKDPAYQVGLTPDGRVTLRVGSSYYDSTLTMNADGVRHLIRVLEAAIPDPVIFDEVDETESEE